MVAPEGLIVAIDTSGDVAGVAIGEGGILIAETTWQARQAHSRELLPALDWLLTRAGRGKDEIAGVCVCLGPGSYAGLRVGLSTTKALAYSLDASLAGVGRLAADALPIALTTDARVIPLQAAGRAELAWAAYAGIRTYGHTGRELDELIAPRLDPAGVLLEAIQPGDIVCGELRSLPAPLIDSIIARGARIVEVSPNRVIAIAALGQARLARGDIDNADTLVPMYLRAPAIGPQR
ncbi:MAG: tRNA (adenosine(37)-N6)-threonylcarbamoyltransferase complex dimerization subunit type 1 TsaB [Dehalococcoidia bacterium]|nr:tRNA (adenosine(37)-N6)-threonylcarbamoyltransferase complex dimerization subunit type 1 TsaB [Dehalococcoidia bacterium]